MKIMNKGARWLLILTLTLLLLSGRLDAAKKRRIRKMTLQDTMANLPDKVRILTECTGSNCTRTCPLNYELDGERRFCRHKRQSICPAGYVGRGAGCVLEDINCPPGSTREGSRCVVTSYSCPAGYAQRGASCIKDNVCQPGYRWENGLCFPQRAQVFPSCTDCCDCQDETVAAQCPVGYVNQWAKCVKVMQAAPDLQIRTLTYKLPVECQPDETYNAGRCEKSIHEKPQCTVGHFYNGSCVEVAKCARGKLNNVCSCETETVSPPTCAMGRLTGSSCVVARVQCRFPSRLLNGACVREIKIRSSCPEGVPFMGDYCAIGEPQCPKGLTLEDGLCKKSVPCEQNCSPYQKVERWCGLQALCSEGYILNEHGYCVRETTTSSHSCPNGMQEQKDYCVSLTPLCRSDFRYEPHYDMCTKCDEQPPQCAVFNATLQKDVCIWSEAACPEGYTWSDGMCAANSARKYQCKRGYDHESMCVHSELNCPPGYELVGESCMAREDMQCPNGTYPVEGTCSVPKVCPTGFDLATDFCVRENRRVIDSEEQKCTGDFLYDGSSCSQRVVVDAKLTRKEIICPEGYSLRANVGCVRTIHIFPVCPPRTIYTDTHDQCFCEVDLSCPNGYERAGTECSYRSPDYTPFLHFLNPCYGALCNFMYCLSQCSNPPCAVEPCSKSVLTPSNQYMAAPGRCGGTAGGDAGNDCPIPEMVSMMCPPGFQRVNGSCMAYYKKVCPDGYEMNGDSTCVREEVLPPICPAGYHAHQGDCIHMACPAGYKRIDSSCERIQYQPPRPCSAGWDFYNGLCYNRQDCRNGTIDGMYCVEREFREASCPAGFIQRDSVCITEGYCRDSTYVDGMCVRTTNPLPCPEETYRQGKLCIFPDPPDCEAVAYVPTQCTTEVDKQGRCWKHSKPICRPNYRLRDGHCVSCQTEKTTCPPQMAIVRGVCVMEKQICPNGYFLRNGVCVKLQIVRPHCPSGEFELCGKNCITPPKYECTGAEYTVATCKRGFLRNGKCVILGTCEPGYVMTKGECRSKFIQQPSCHGKGSRINDVCVANTPQCPPGTSHIDGHCRSWQIENAHCTRSGLSCADSFCHIDSPRCGPSLSFEGHSCRYIAATKPTCPVGTDSDRYDANFCQLKTEKATYNCPEDYTYQNGVCLKKTYAAATCPAGYKLRQNVCVKRVCSRVPTTISCTPDAISSCTSCPANVPPNPQSHQTPTGGSQATSDTGSSFDLCCNVFSPRICEWGKPCYHYSNRQCGSFCFSEDEQIFLSVSKTTRKGALLIVAPRDLDGYDYEDDELDETVVNCDPCLTSQDACPRQCNLYDCQTTDGDCNFIDAVTFCTQHGGNVCSLVE